MESECPACKKFSTTYLKELMSDPEMREIMDFRFVPWGNGLISSSDGVQTKFYNTTESLTLITRQYQQVLAQMTYDQTHNYLEKLMHSAKQDISAAWSSVFFKSETQTLNIQQQLPKPPQLNFNCQHGFSECAGNADRKAHV